MDLPATRGAARPGPTGRSTIRSRLAWILSVPLVAVLLLLGNLVLAEFDEYGVANDASRTTHIGQVAQGLVHELQRERGLSTGLLGGFATFRADLDTARGGVDRARAALAAATTTENANARSALEQLADLAAMRAQVDAARIDRSTAFQYYTDRISALNHVDLGLDRPSPAPDPELRRSTATFQALSAVKEALATERGVLMGTLSTGRFDRDEYSQFVGARAARQTAVTEYLRYADADQRGELDNVLKTPAATEFGRYEQVAVEASDGRPIEVASQPWWASASAVIDDFRGLQLEIGVDIEHRTDELRGEARWDLFGLLPLIAASLVAAAVLVIAATRSIVRPLAALVAEADEIATLRLPNAVDGIQHAEDHARPPDGVHTTPNASVEIRSVAAAIDRMQHTAYALATEQAVLRRNTVDSLANLGRRTQNLLRRQLAFISQLEREEGDPTALANLFELDHLATRLRRNAESLLVLVGEASPRRWSTPLPVADVLRAAVAEVEEYRRVALRRIDDAFIGGGYVTDMAHLLAELIENGLTFSPPDVEVEVHGRVIGQNYLIAIVDHGIGMEPEDLARANARLRGEERFTVAPTRFLGHYVVGDLARDLKVDVQIVQSPVTGVTARVVLPATILATTTADLETAQVVDGRATAGQRHPALDAPRVGGALAAPTPGPLGAVTFDVAPTGPVPALAAPTLAAPADRPARAPVPDPVSVAMAVSAFDGNPVPPPPPPAGSIPRARRGVGTGTAAAAAAAADPGDRQQHRPWDTPLGPGPDRTRNGLPKRTPRQRGAGGSRQPTAGHQPQAPQSDRKPADVRTMLTSLRDGVRRGQTSQTPEPTWFPGGATDMLTRGDV